MGGTGGGQISIVTHSGSSQYHGTVYEFLRNGVMDAGTFGSMGNNHLVQNNFGAAFGGPLIRKNTFFFANYEGLRLAQADAQILAVPTHSPGLLGRIAYLSHREVLGSLRHRKFRPDHLDHHTVSFLVRQSKNM
jgi:hypothetical protein